MKSIIEIRNEALEVLINLESSFISLDGKEEKITYLEIRLIESILNAIKHLEYHYRDDIEGMRLKKNWDEYLIKANAFLKKYGECKDEYSPYTLQKKFDNTGYIENRDFID